jgi:sialic acid synthase SpsE
MNQANELLSLSLGENEKTYAQRLKQDINVFKKSLYEQKKLMAMNILDRNLNSQLKENSEDLL